MAARHRGARAGAGGVDVSRHPDGAFLFWPSDWLTDERVRLMSPAARGAYIDLLCHCWIEGSIPACSTQCARIVGIEQSAFESLWSELCACFSEHPERAGRMIQERMERERRFAEGRRKSRSDRGKRAASARWGAQRRRHANGNADAMHGDGSDAMPQDAHPNPKQVPRSSSTERSSGTEGRPSGDAAAAGERHTPNRMGSGTLADRLIERGTKR